ncbi:hypothetical protein GCM10007416_08440 [Kroppenstedtia guangzhouensis]|uniref:Uncharacterized protein n=1 Tax=Kroppenstedtia guangzhouensis TaxID=1274356 RepID=A0ABQ1G6S5_9BACL|nr:hypothetical protein [Kroppenstedtia guangzhouensis]GGA37830.1 hypothetical protein GCM10007416_08440 [Kroppenstedtia guangzhouensis]
MSRADFLYSSVQVSPCALSKGSETALTLPGPGKGFTGHACAVIFFERPPPGMRGNRGGTAGTFLVPEGMKGFFILVEGDETDEGE